MMFEPYTDWTLIPEHMHSAIRRYVEQREPVGDFLTAVLSNDLRAAVMHADDLNLPSLPDYVRFLYRYAPAPCWGSPERVRTWLAQRRLAV